MSRWIGALGNARREGRLHHAYLLCGPESPAKRLTAETLAAEFAAAKTGVGKEALLARIQRGNHPDFVVLQPEEGVINVELIRTLPRMLAYAPLESERRVVLIPEAEKMNSQAANALLKILEEPPGHTMFFLLCREPTDLLPTIQSRCQALRFPPLDRETLLSSVPEMEPAAQAQILAWSEGSLARAKELAERDGALALSAEAREALLSLWSSSPRVPSAALAWVDSVDSDENGRLAVDSWELLLRDFAFTLAGANKQDLLYPDLYPRLRAFGSSAELFTEVSGKTAAINRFRVYRQLNGNLKLDLTALLTELQVFSVGKASSTE